jgi:hypothetical protein
MKIRTEKKNNDRKQTKIYVKKEYNARKVRKERSVERKEE